MTVLNAFINFSYRTDTYSLVATWGIVEFNSYFGSLSHLSDYSWDVHDCQVLTYTRIHILYVSQRL